MFHPSWLTPSGPPWICKIKGYLFPSLYTNGYVKTPSIVFPSLESFQGLESILNDYTYTDNDKRIHFSTKDPEGDMPKIIRILSDSGAHIQRIETDKSSLEDVFLNLTGKGINKWIGLDLKR